jgi:hypothetical protein
VPPTTLKERVFELQLPSTKLLGTTISFRNTDDRSCRVHLASSTFGLPFAHKPSIHMTYEIWIRGFTVNFTGAFVMSQEDSNALSKLYGDPCVISLAVRPDGKQRCDSSDVDSEDEDTGDIATSSRHPWAWMVGRRISRVVVSCTSGAWPRETLNEMP